MKRLNKRIKLVMMAVIAIMGVIFLSHNLNVHAEGYTTAPQEVVFGQTYSGTINTTADMYRYNMSLKKAGTVKIAVGLSNPHNSGNFLIVKIYDESGEKLYDKLVENSYFDITVNLNKGNYYIVADGAMGGWDMTFKLTPTYKEFSTTSVKKLTNKATRKLVVTWTKKATVSGYQIQIATNSKFTKNKKTYTVNNAVTTSKTITKLKKSKKYYVRIRTYTMTLDGTKAYSNWSSIKSKKITK